MIKLFKELNEIRRLPIAIRREILSTLFLPHPTRHENIQFWMTLMSSAVIQVFPLVVVGYYGISAIPVAIVSKVLLAIYFYLWMARIFIGVPILAIKQMIDQKTAANMKQSIENINRKLMEELQKKTGRSDIPNDPISMSAAVIDADGVKRPSGNPLLAALNNELDIITPTDNEEENG